MNNLRSLRTIGIASGFLLLTSIAQAQAWQPVGEDTYVRNFISSTGMPFTCVMVKGGGEMAGDVKTVTCLEVKNVSISQETLHEIEALRQFMSESREMSVVPGKSNAPAPKASRGCP